GVGGLALPDWWWGLWLAAGAVFVFVVMFFVLVLSGKWWAPLGYAMGALLCLGLGSLVAEPLSESLRDGFDIALSLRPLQPWWLLLLLLVPVIAWLSYRSLAGLGEKRRWMAIILRSALVILLTLALAEVRLTHESETMTILFVLDRSLSIPEELEKDPNSATGTIDRRQERIRKFINDTVESHGRNHTRDRAGLIVFGRQPKLELQPSPTPRFNFKEVTSPIENNYTDIAAAIKLALASFPEGTGKRVVLLSDGNENLGVAEEQARLAKLNGVQIDVVTLAAGQRNQNEVLVESVSAPTQIEKGSQLAITVRIRSFNPNLVFGKLSLHKVSEGNSIPVKDSPKKVVLEPGLNSITFSDTVDQEEQSYSYEAEFQPEGVQDADGNVLVRGLPGSKPQNKRATTHVVARGERRILLVEAKKDEHRFLFDQLLAAGNSKFKVTRKLVEELPVDKDKLGVFLSNFDSIILANVPAESLSEDQMEMLRSNTHDQGCGLVMIGGPDGFGAGGWQGTPVEKALPVDADIKALNVQGKGGLVLIMHASEMANGNFWQKKIAKLAIEKLSPADEVGVLYFDWGVTKWHIQLQEIGDKKARLMAEVDKMSPGDMPDFDPSLRKAHEALTDPKRELAVKHVILISDGDPPYSPAVLTPFKKDKVTVTTVGVATHGPAQDKSMLDIAKATGGRFHNPKDPSKLPAIYIKETRLVSQAFIYERRFMPHLVFRSGPTEKLPDPPPLFGFVRTTPKANPLVEIPIESPPIAEQKFPILAHWHYGLGKAVAFTSDALNKWDKDWAASEMYGKFWEQVIDWSLRAVESKKLTLTAEQQEGKVKLVVVARDEQNRPITNLNLRGGVTTPGGKGEGPQDIVFRQTNSGSYEAEVKAQSAGSYFITAQATRKVKVVNKDGKEEWVDEGFDSVRAGVTIPYSPEFAVMESNVPLMERLRDLTDGNNYADADAPLETAARSGEIFRKGVAPSKSSQPIWYWLLLACGVLLFFDVAVRRIAVEPERVTAAGRRVWDRLRGRAAVVEQTPEFFDRLKSRKAQVSETLGKAKATKRFEGGDAPLSAPLGATDEPPRMVRPLPPAGQGPGFAPEAEKQDAGDFGSRLLRAKNRVWDDKNKDKGN
ncbi:MAG TPA: VWA domain-containing protein, partial [Gemmataceae bacterium]